MKSVRLYNVSDEYVNYLRKFDNKVLSNKEENRVKERKYLGIVLKISDFNYFVPLSSPKESDYETIDGNRKIRNSVVPLMRIVSTNNLGEKELKGTIKFSSMIPIPKCALISFNIQDEPNKDYKILLEKEINFIFDNLDKIFKNAVVIHNQKINNYTQKYLDSTVDFKLLEEKCLDYNKRNILHKSAILDIVEDMVKISSDDIA